MDTTTLAAAIGIIRKIPDSAAERAERAAREAEIAAESASAHNYTVTITGTTLNIIENEGDV